MNKLTLFISALFFVILNVSQAWALPNCVGQRSVAWQNCFGTYTFSSGNKYVGEFGDDKYLGQEGIFKDDVFQYAQKKSKLDKHKDFCKEIGFTPKTVVFGNCVLKLMDKD